MSFFLNWTLWSALLSILSQFCSVYRDLGAHLDGFIGVVAHTVVVGASTVLIRPINMLLLFFYALPFLDGFACACFVLIVAL